MKYIRLLFVLVFAVASVWLAISNRQGVPVYFDPFAAADNGAFALKVPLFLILFGGVAVGLVIGSVTTWFAQGRHRQRARVEKRQVRALEKELDTVRVSDAEAGGAAA